jgi:hypothetical protein
MDSPPRLGPYDEKGKIANERAEYEATLAAEGIQ